MGLSGGIVPLKPARITSAQLKANPMTTQRITLKFLNAQCERLNRLEGSPLEAYSKDETTGKFTANIGNYHISQAYGGYSLHRMATTGGGVSTPLSIGHVPARELSGLLSAYIAGMNRVLWLRRYSPVLFATSSIFPAISNNTTARNI